MLFEEISLSASVDDLDEDHPSPAHEVTALLEQVNWLRRSRSTFTLSSDHRLSVVTQGLMQKALNFSIDTSILDPQPKRLFRICWQFLLLAVALFAASWISALNPVGPGILLPLLLGTAAVAALIAAVFRSHDRLVYYSQSGRVPLVVLFNRLPDPASLADFTRVLEQQINAARALQTSASESLIDELKAHRQLMQDGVISSRRYDIVKQRILSLHQ